MQAESVVSEVLGQMMQEISSTEIRKERQRVAEEEQKLEEARFFDFVIIHVMLKGVTRGRAGVTGAALARHWIVP